jgi:CubicO group peptidase (beta-lactamase class C family)
MAAMLTVHGSVKPGFEPVEAAFRENFERRGEIGASACAWHDGEKVVDLWGGLADRDSGRPWEADTVTVVFSATKGLVALCLLMLADRGKLDYDRPVANYWPEFAAAGKERVTVRELLNHRAGLHVVDEPHSLEDWTRSERIAPALAKQRPSWQPGSDQGYGAVSAGAYAAELFRRVAGRSVGTFLAEEVARPLAADAYIGIPAEIQPRVATIYPAKPGTPHLKLIPEVFTGRTVEGRIVRALLRRNSFTRRAVGNPRMGRKGLQHFNDPEVQARELPWAGGIASARGLAEIYAALAHGGTQAGVSLCSAESIAPLRARQSWSERDRVMQKPLGFSQGFLKDALHVFAPGEEAFGHPGIGGALGLADPDRRLSFGYVMNRMDHRIRSPRCLALCHALYGCIQDPPEKT